MDKEKNINDLLSSIRKLINEAEDEVLNFQNKERLIDIGSALPNKEKPLEECSVKNTNQNILTNDRHKFPLRSRFQSCLDCQHSKKYQYDQT